MCHHPSPTALYTLSLHDALPISSSQRASITIEQSLAASPSPPPRSAALVRCTSSAVPGHSTDRKSTRLNSSHVAISYAVFCLKKKKNVKRLPPITTQHGVA